MKGVLLALDVAYEDVIVPESFLGGGIFLDLDEEKVVRYLEGFLCRFHCRFGVDVLCAPFMEFIFLVFCPQAMETAQSKAAIDSIRFIVYRLISSNKYLILCVGTKGVSLARPLPFPSAMAE